MKLSTSLLPMISLLTVSRAIQATGQCVDLVQDCGGKADNHTDNAQAFVVCQHLASQRSGCITVPAGLFQTSPVVLNTSHTEFRISNDAVLLPWVGMNQSGYLFAIGTPKATVVEYVENISIHGKAPGQFTVDLSVALYTPWNVRAFGYWGGIKGFVLANMLCKDADPQRSNRTIYKSNKACIGVNHESVGDVRLNPQDGVLHNLTCTGCVFGYGLMQVRSGERISVKNVYSEGGITLRMETDGGIAGYLNDVEAQNITCKDGHAAVASVPHVQRNGVFHVRDVISYGCNVALGIGAGYTQEGYPPGYFSNSSTISNVVAYYGTHSQNSSKDIDVPACTLCAHGYNLPMNYIVTLTNTTTIGFPRPSNRTECVPYAYWKGCPWNT